MTDRATLQTSSRGKQRPAGFVLRTWVYANAAGLGGAYALLALFGDGVEALGAGHESITRDLAGLVGMLIGVGLFMTMRRRVLAPHLDGSVWAAIAAGIGLAVGFAVGFVIAGPPFDFVLGVITLGTIGGALERRALRGQLARPTGLMLAGIGAWITAGIAALVVAIVAGDAIDTALGSGITGFVAVTLVIGLVAGAVGGAIEGAALRRRL